MWHRSSNITHTDALCLLRPYDPEECSLGPDIHIQASGLTATGLRQLMQLQRERPIQQL